VLASGLRTMADGTLSGLRAMADGTLLSKFTSAVQNFSTPLIVAT